MYVDVCVQPKYFKSAKTGLVKCAGSVVSAVTHRCTREVCPLDGTVMSLEGFVFFLLFTKLRQQSIDVWYSVSKNEEILISLLLETLTFPGKT